MANRTRSQLSVDSSTLFPNNTSQLISPQDLRDWITNGIDSFVTQKDKSTLTNALYESESTAIASASNCDLSIADGNFVHITGDATITSFGDCPEGSRFILVFDGTPTITYNATSLIIPGSTNKTAAINDCCMIVSEGGGNWRIVGYFPISGTGGGGGGTVTSIATSSPITGGTITGSGTIGIQDASADGSTKGAATFNASDFNASSGVISIDYANGQKASGSQDGFLSSTDWTTFSSKGTGTVTTTGTPTSGQITKFSGATSITNATAGTDYLAPPSGTAILKANSGGALANAVSGTDYAPATSGTAILKGSGSGGFSNATAGSDYLAPPSGTAILKANSGGALTNASAGTDYVAPGLATGSGLTMSTSRLLGRTTASTGAIEEIQLTTTGTSGAATLTGGTLNIPQYSGGGGSGTVNSGTANRLTYYAATGTTVSELPTAGSSGQILQSNGTGSAPSWVNAPAATLSIGSTITSGTNGSVLFVGSGQLQQDNTNFFFDNTNDRLSIGGSTSPGGRLQLAAGSATVPHVILTPTSGVTPTGTTNGSLWMDTTSSNTSLTLYKDSSNTKLVTIDRNPDLATGATGVVISDSSGSLSKSADLTALGIYSAYANQSASTNLTATSLISSSIAGSLSLPANYFALGKTIKVMLTGTITCASNDTSSISVWLTNSIAALSVTGLPSSSSKAFTMEMTMVCTAVGASATLMISGWFAIATNTPTATHYFIFTPTVSSTFNSASALTFDLKNQWGQSGCTVTVNSNMAYFIN